MENLNRGLTMKTTTKVQGNYSCIFVGKNLDHLQRIKFVFRSILDELVSKAESNKLKNFLEALRSDQDKYYLEFTKESNSDPMKLAHYMAKSQEKVNRIPILIKDKSIEVSLPILTINVNVENLNGEIVINESLVQDDIVSIYKKMA